MGSLLSFLVEITSETSTKNFSYLFGAKKVSSFMNLFNIMSNDRLEIEAISFNG